MTHGLNHCARKMNKLIIKGPERCNTIESDRGEGKRVQTKWNVTNQDQESINTCSTHRNDNGTKKPNASIVRIRPWNKSDKMVRLPSENLLEIFFDVRKFWSLLSRGFPNHQSMRNALSKACGLLDQINKKHSSSPSNPIYNLENFMYLKNLQSYVS